MASTWRLILRQVARELSRARPRAIRVKPRNHSGFVLIPVKGSCVGAAAGAAGDAVNGKAVGAAGGGAAGVVVGGEGGPAVVFVTGGTGGAVVEVVEVVDVVEVVVVDVVVVVVVQSPTLTL